MSDPRASASSVVLVVEDEGLVRMMAIDMLEDAGLSVIEAMCADEAWAILKSRSDINILFTDIEMPGSMNGFVLAERVARRWPHIRLVMTSGRCRPHPRGVPDHSMFVAKPYRADQVLSAFERAGSL